MAALNTTRRHMERLAVGETITAPPRQRKASLAEGIAAVVIALIVIGALVVLP